jgi:hypothetical protein
LKTTTEIEWEELDVSDEEEEKEEHDNKKDKGMGMSPTSNKTSNNSNNNNNKETRKGPTASMKLPTGGGTTKRSTTKPADWKQQGIMGFFAKK